MAGPTFEASPLQAGDDAIKEEVFWNSADLFKLDVDLVFYDATTAWFETDDEDVSNYTWKGLTFEPLRKLGDAGMYSAANLKELSKGAGRYILATSVGKVKRADPLAGSFTIKTERMTASSAVLDISDSRTIMLKQHDVSLDALSAERLTRIEEAGALAETKHNVVTEMLRHHGEFKEWKHYPEGDVFDQKSHAQFYYHAHVAEERGDGEQGHVHTFLRGGGMPADVQPAALPDFVMLARPNDLICHVIGLSMDVYGQAFRLFTTNSWVTGETWFEAPDVIRLVDGFRIDHTQPSWPTNRWISAMVTVFRPQIEALTHARDDAMAAWAKQHPDETMHEDRALNVTSEMWISLDEQLDLGAAKDGTPITVISDGSAAPRLSEGKFEKIGFRHWFGCGIEVSFDQWDACRADGVCKNRGADERFGRGQRPAISLSLDDAKQFLAWLSDKTGHGYRLPTEAEWEYAAGAGTTTLYYWGDEIGKANAVCESCGTKWDNKRSAPTGSFPPNPFGLHDIVITPQLKREARFWDPVWTRALIRDALEDWPVDWSRLSVAGLSIGGTGVWDFLSTYPEDVWSAVSFSAVA